MVGGGGELGLIVGLAGHAGVDRCEQGVDVWNQFLADGIGGQLWNCRLINSPKEVR